MVEGKLADEAGRRLAMNIGFAGIGPSRENPDTLDEFARCGITGPEQLGEQFVRSFYFGCEADDPMTAVAFDARLDAPLKPIFSSDVGHFDVPVMNEVVAEAFELVETGLLTEEQFERFVFGNVVELHAGMNPRFFDGTVMEVALSKGMHSS